MNAYQLVVETSSATAGKRHNWLGLVLFVCGVFAVQRFTLDPFNAVICVIPFGLFVVNMLQGHQRAALSCLVLALLLAVDNGAEVYAETVSPLRYLIYFSVIAVLFSLSRWRIRTKPLVIATLLCCGILIGSLTSSFLGGVPLDAGTLQRDLLVLFILSVFLLARGSAQLDLQLIYCGSLGYLAGEVLNSLFFYRDFTEYLNYDSLKVFVVFPLAYAILMRKNFVILTILGVSTLYVIFLYGTRMITLSLMLLFFLASIVHAVRHGQGRFLLCFLIILILLTNINLVGIVNESEIGQFKALAFLFQILDILKESDIYQMLAQIDAVRFAEHQLFFDRPMSLIMFGSGLGSGIFDSSGVLGFVTFDQTAFSEEEISSSTYFGLHDFWIDFGFRFGMLPVVYLVICMTLHPMWKGSLMKGVLFGVVLLNATFATSGILLMAMLVRLWPMESTSGKENVLIAHRNFS